MYRYDFSRSSSDQDVYQVNGDEYVIIRLSTGDRVEITDLHGDQPCLMQVFDESGKIAPEALGISASKVEKISIKLSGLLSSSIDQSVLRQELIKYKVDIEEIIGFTPFPKQSKPNSQASFSVANNCCVLVLGLSSDMQVEDQNAPTPLRVSLIRQEVHADVQLPAPLAKTLQDFRIPHSSARAYKVKAGEYFQIIDVEGHQCSDFQCFAVSDVEKNQYNAIDTTVSRTFSCSSYPTPGFYSKYYNQESVPLTEVVQDTVGRHDTFGLACNSKYYDDMGYFGHSNCTDNFNNTLSGYGISPRKNWSTVNLFFNTNIENCGALSSDVSWSRPGDYVLMRALTDLICVSSACPDNVYPSNGWDPTDIHIRVYGSENKFYRSNALRPTPKSIPIMTKETGFHKKFAEHTRHFIDYSGYWLANNFNNYGAVKEYWACRERVVLMDLSPLRKYEVYGYDAEKLLQLALTRNVRRLAIGQVVYSAMCYENGGMVDDGTLFRLCENNFRWIGGSDDSGIQLSKLAKEHNMKVWVKPSTDQLHNIAVQGPKSRDVIRKFLWTCPTQSTIDELGWFRFTIGRIHEELGTPIMVSRTGYTGELGYEIWCHPKDAALVWQTVWEAGEEFDIAPLGLEALDVLRIEAGLIFAGHEFNDQTDPIEAGVGFTVPLKTKEDDFIGRAAIQKRKDNPQHKLVGLELEQQEVAEHGDGVYVGKQQVGIITSGTRSPILKKNIALCRISVDHAEIDMVLEVGKLDGHQKRMPAKVVPFPFFDPEKIRVRQ